MSVWSRQHRRRLTTPASRPIGSGTASPTWLMMAKAIRPKAKDGEERSAVRYQTRSDHRKTARHAAKPPIVHAVSTRNMCQCSQLPAGSKAAIFDGKKTDRKP